jgi:hypothetical protein
MTRVFCDRQKCDPQFVRLSDPTFVRPTTKKRHLSDLRLKMRRLSDLGLKHDVCPTRSLSDPKFVRPDICPTRRLSDLYIKCVICPTYTKCVICPTRCLSDPMFVRPDICPTWCLSDLTLVKKSLKCPSVHLSVCPSVRPSVPSTFLLEEKRKLWKNAWFWEQSTTNLFFLLLYHTFSFNIWSLCPVLT